MGGGRAAIARWALVRALVMALGLTTMATLAGCGTPITPVASPGIPSGSAQSGDSGPGAPTPGTGSAAPVPPTPRPTTAPPCGTGDLSFVAENAAFAINSRELQLRATKRSAAACAVSGRPILHLGLDGEDLGIVTVDHLDGRAAPVVPGRDGGGDSQSGGTGADEGGSVVREPDSTGADTGTSTGTGTGTGSVVLLPGESTVSVLQWRAQQWATESHTEVLLVELDGGAGPPAIVSWGAGLPSGSSPIRVDEGDPLAASAWSGARTGPIPGGG